MPAGLAGAARALSASAPDTASVHVTGGWLLLCYVGYAGAFVWTAVEGLREHAMASRRLALGLADPVVVDRFRLWTLYGVSCTGITAANAVGVLLERNLSTSLVVLLPSAVLGLAAASAMVLAFLPPAWYLARVRARASPAPA
jgi:hypothetical protein